ncbi:lamin tail domain-containing protein [Enemella dayhoffiae]|uniref:lamin tail domain-containing protein n=1 Tax=Enemella dayhoffiae TaxID=2016507 RepID=UPI001595795E|nr:lamin tail domain-containing protein [Enemella dayhoffiae]
MPTAPTRTLTGVVAAVATLALTAQLWASGLPRAAALEPAPAVVVTEIAPDNTGADNFEFVELHNPTVTSVDLSAQRISYIYADSADRTPDVALRVPAGTTLAAGETAVLWVDYTAGTVDTSTRTEQQFRDFWAANGQPATAYRIVRVTGQPGLANGGDRGLRISTADGTELSRSFYPAGSVGVNLTATFDHRTATTTSMTLTGRQATATPGALPAPTTPTPTRTPTTPTPTPTPTTPTPTPNPRVCTPGATSPLQITELLVDSDNVGGADGYEFIEVTNTSDRAIAYADFHLNYLYPLDDLTHSQVAAWPAQPADPVIQPGASLVLWIKNGGNQALDAAAFNARFGTNLTAGTQLVEVQSAGMANGSPRGLEIVTNTGTSVNRAYYNLAGADDVDPNQGIQYATDPADPPRQRLLGKAAPTPGSTSAAQTPLCVALPTDTTAPVITDGTGSQITPGQDFGLSATVTDDLGVRTVTVWTRSDVDATFTPTRLTVGPGDSYAHTISAADLTGKRWIDHYWTASDGTNTTTSPTARATVTGVDTAPIRLSVTDGQCLRGTTTVFADGRAYPSPLTLTVNNTDVTAQTSPTLAGEPVFAMEAGGVNTFFKNGI